MTKHQYAYKYRLYPTEKQKEYIEQHFGCSRFIYNWGLGIKKDIYEKSKVSVSKNQLQKILSWYLKDEYPFLKEVDSTCLIYSLMNLETAFKNFFRNVKNGNKEAGYPKFKSKYKSTRSYQFHQGYKYNLDENNKNEGWIMPPKFSKRNIKKGYIDECKIKMITHHRPPKQAKGKTVTISRTPSGEYYASILFEWETKRETRYKYEPNNKIIGIDLGIKDFLITSEGDKYNLSDSLYDVHDKFLRINRKVSKKRLRNKNWRNSNRYSKDMKRKAKYERKKVRIREQDHYDIIHDIFNKHKPKVIGIESLKIQNMIKNKKLSKSIVDQGWGEFIIRLKNKCDERGIRLVKIDQWFPSSQLCSTCGQNNEKVKNLSVREWTCDNCGFTHDRDINASKNIMKKSKEILDNE